MRTHQYPPFALLLLLIGGCETHINTDCPPGTRCVVICDQAGHDCRVEVEETDAAVESDAQPDPDDSGVPDAPPEPEPAPQPNAEPEPEGEATCAALCAALDKDQAECVLNVLRAAHPDCDRAPACEDLLNPVACGDCFAALGSDCAAVGALCVSR